MSDLLLLPFQPGNFDLWTLEQVEQLVEDVRSVNDRLRAVAYISRGMPQGADNRDALEMLRGSKVIEAAAVVLTNRKAFNSAAGEGLALIEAAPRQAEERRRWEKAKAEVDALYAACFDGNSTAQ